MITIEALDDVLPDTTDPIAVVTTPADGMEIDVTSSYQLEGSYSDDQSGVNWVRVRIQRLGVSPNEYWNGTVWSEVAAWVNVELDGSDGWVLSGVDFSEAGSYSIRLISRDNAGNLSSAAENPVLIIDAVSL